MTVERRVTCDLVLFDRGSNNPYRHLMPAAVHHPALLNGILAVAARHHSNLCGTPVSKHLPYKGASFGYLSRDLQRLDSKAILTESTLAVVMLFLFFETLDGGLNTWKIHLSGARRLIQMCLSLESLPAETLAMLRIFMNHVALVDIIGRTLAFGSTSSDPGVFDTNVPEFLTFLRDGEQYNFLGCPAPLLETIHAITQLKHSPLDQSPENYIGTCQALLANIDTFSADAYVVSRVDINDAKDSSSLHRLVCAYKCAARIYAVETLFSTVATSDTTEPYHAELRMHISSLESGSLFMKGAVWPVFIAGTGARGLDERCWVREQLKRLWEVLPQGNIKNAGKVLEDIWMKVDEQGGMVHGWRILEEGASDWLFV